MTGKTSFWNWKYFFQNNQFKKMRTKTLSTVPLLRCAILSGWSKVPFVVPVKRSSAWNKCVKYITGLFFKEEYHLMYFFYPPPPPPFATPNPFPPSFDLFSIFGDLILRSFGFSEFWTFGVLTLRNFGFSEFWTFGVLGFRSFDPSEFWPFGVLHRYRL